MIAILDYICLGFKANIRKDAGVVERGGLEIRYTALLYPGFESLSLRNKGCKSSICKIYTLFYTQKSTTGCRLYALLLVILFISFLTLLYFIFSFCN